MATSTVVRWILAAEFALGGAVRLQPQLMPSTSGFVFGKADGFFRHLPWIPGTTAKSKTESIGVALCTASAAFLLATRPKTGRIAAALYGGTISTIMLVGEASIAGDIWLPIINIVAAAYLVYSDRR